MKIVVSGYIGKKITGIGRNLINLLDNSSPEMYYVVYTNDDLKDDLVFNNKNVDVKTYSASKNSSLKNLLWTTFVFPWMALKEKADVTLIPNFTLLLFKFKPTVVIMHDLIEFNVPEKFSKMRMFYRTKIADPLMAKKANHIVTVSENSKRDIVKFLKTSENKVTVIYNGVDRTKFKPIDKTKAKTIIIDKGWPENFLLYAGTIDHPGKNAMGVIKAFEGLKSSGRYGGCLILAGMPGANYEVVDEYVSKSKYRNDIVITGFVTDDELIALYNICQVFVFISLYEGFGIPPLEALACGAKVVVSNTSSLPEVVGNVGWTVDPLDAQAVENVIADALSTVISDKKKLKVEEHLKSYDWKKLGCKFENVLIKVGMND